MPGEDQFEVLSFWECWWGLRKNISNLHGFSFINSRPVGKEMQSFWKGLLRLMVWRAHVQCLHLLDPWISPCVKWNICHCDASWHILVLSLLEGARIWKEASHISCSQNPAVSCPLCKLPVNEWAGHLTPWGSTSGSSDHQLLCLGLSHAPVSMMNPEHGCKALTSPYVSSSSSSSLQASNIKCDGLRWKIETKYSSTKVFIKHLEDKSELYFWTVHFRDVND